MDVEIRTRRGGKRPPEHDDRTFQLARYIGPKLPLPPLNCDWTARAKKPWGWMLNDKLGICPFASQGHAIQVWSAASGEEVTVPDGAVLDAYKRTGYDPRAPLLPNGDNPTDNGATMIEALKLWQKVGIGGHKILAYAKVNIHNRREVKQAISIFGVLYTGLALPTACEDQSVWSMAGAGRAPLKGDFEPGSWGGHCVPIAAYTQDDLLTAITWNQKLLLTVAYLQNYCDEAYVAISHDWVREDAKSPSGFDLLTLSNDLHALNRDPRKHSRRSGP